jgi:quinoprotein glucose dehydrogenase
MRNGSGRSGGVVTAVLGFLLLLFGLVLLAGGVWLISLGGSWYYAVAGLGLIASGWLMLRRRSLGGFLYLAVFALTVLWALWEVGLNGWALVPRLVGPAVLAVLVALVLPRLSENDARGRAAKLSGLGLAAVLVLALIGVFMANRPAPARALPPALAAGVTAVRQAGADWPVYGGGDEQQHYSSLAQITPANVSNLTRAWTYRTRDLPPGRWGAETTPLKIGNRVFLCTARNRLAALDARTGKEIWRYDPKVPNKFIPYTAACRGVTYYDGAGAQLTPNGQAATATVGSTRACLPRIIEGTLDGRLIAVDAATGVPCPGFGNDGQVDIKVGMGPMAPGMVSITSAPTIVRGVIVTGHQVLDGQRRDAPSGVIQGYDAVTGALRWAWDMKRPDITGLPPAGQTYSLGTPNMWTTASGDERLGLVYLPMGNSAADYWSSSRTPLEDKYATSLVAIDVTTGKPAWNFQTTHIDVWDYDLGSQASLVDYPTTAGPIPALVLPSKQGDIYILDRRTGQPLTGVEERRVPQGGLEPSRRSATQPFSLFHTLARPMLTERDMWGMSPIDQMACRIQFRQASYQGMYTPPTVDRHWIEYPGYNGGSDWGGVAVDPRRGLIIANYNDTPNFNILVPRAEANRRGWFPRGDPRGQSAGAAARGAPEGAGDPQTGVPYAISVNAGWRQGFTKLLCKQPPYGGIRAIDLRTGQTVWDRPLGTARKNGPFGIPSMLPVDIGTPNNGGSVVTASGLVFIAAATDDLIRAIDIRTGKTVWSDVLPAGGQATPMTYEADGRQYLVIVATGHHFMETTEGDYVIAYALPQA